MSQAADLLALAVAGNLPQDLDESGGTGAPEATTAAPTANDAATTAAPQVDAQQQQQQEPEAPIASKSGSYTIPYEKLTEARDKAAQATLLAEERDRENAQLKAQLSALQQQNLVNAQAQAQARSDAGHGPSVADQNLATAEAAIANGVDPAIFSDYSEEGLAKGVAIAFGTLSAPLIKEINELKAERDERRALEAQQQTQSQQTAQQAHVQEILSKHADAFEVVESAEWTKWRQSLPAHVRMGADAVLQSGTAAEVNELLSSFKESQGAPAADAANKVRQAIEQAQAAVPSSLSSIGGAQSAQSGAEAVLSVADNPLALLQRVGSMTAQQQTALMNSV